MDHSVQYVFFLYDGEWKIDDDGVSSFVSNSCDGVSVTQNTTYAELVDMIYNALGVDRLRYDLVLKVKYNMGMRNAPPAVIQNDRNLELYLKVTSNTLQELRSPLCVSLIDKSLHSNPTQESKILGVVPDCDLFVNHAEEGELVRCDLAASTGLCPSPTSREQMTSQPRKTSSHTDWLGSSYEPIQIETPDQLSVRGLEVGTFFDNKKELQLRLHRLAMATHFEFKVVKSRKDLWFVKCLDEKCKWRMRATKGKFSEMFEIRKLVKEHTCSILTRKDAGKAPSWVIGECIKRKYMDHHHDHMPKKIMEDMQTNFGLNVTYNKAWRSREKALMAVRGTVEDSYGKLPSYLFMLEKNNPGTITDIQTDQQGHFMYMFMSLGVSIRGFRSSCRPVLCVDASFLKHKVGGQLLVAIALDANEQLYPVAFGVVDSENNNSWTYFMEKLRVAIGSVSDLVFVSDRHPSISNALSVVFPEAHHGACTYHIKMNIMAKFKTDSCHVEFDLAARAYTKPKFYQYFEMIKTKDPRIAAYLEQIGLERWSRAHFPGSRYNQMTSNYAESFNSQSRNARKYPITTLADYLRFTIQEWFHQRREKASNHKEHLSPYYEKYLREQAEKAIYYNINPLNRFEFYVHDGEFDFQVDLQARTCTCRVFDVSGLPCTHALAAARSRKSIPYECCARFYSSEAWCVAYAETCYPVCNEDNWDIPNVIKERVCRKPPVKVKKGRPTTKRRTSQGEPCKERRRCSSCGGLGHNRATCSAVMPAPCTARQSQSSSTQISQSSVQHLA